MTALGTQLLLDLHDCDAALLDDRAGIAAVLRGAAGSAGAAILHESYAGLSPHGGVAGMLVLANACLSIHTLPAERYAAVDVQRFGDADLDAEVCVKVLREGLRSARFEVTTLARGTVLPAPKPYTPLHPALFHYDDAFVARFIDPSVAHNPDAASVTREICEQLYQFELFTPEFCRLLIEEAEHCASWITILEHTVEKHGAVDDLDDLIEPDTTVSWERMPPLVEVYHQIMEHHVRPVVEGLWKTFKLQKWDIPAVRKFEPEVVAGMGLHHDAETVGMVGYLSDGFTGGGTHFPRWNATVGKSGEVVVGSVVVYPGGVSHEHLALPIISGRRYMLANSLY